MHAAILYDDRIPTGGHSKSAGNRTVSCAALERALNSPDLSTFFFWWCESDQRTRSMGATILVFAATHCVSADQIYGISGPNYSSR